MKKNQRIFFEKAFFCERNHTHIHKEKAGEFVRRRSTFITRRLTDNYRARLWHLSTTMPENMYFKRKKAFIRVCPSSVPTDLVTKRQQQFLPLFDLPSPFYILLFPFTLPS